MQKQTIIVAVITLLVGLGGGYYGAHAFTSNNPRGNAAFTRGGTAGTFAFNATGARGQGAAGAGGLSGTVISKDATSITIDTRDGSSHIALTGTSTVVAKSIAGTLDDVVVGSTVLVMGVQNSDGSVSAKSLQIRPADMGPGPR